MVSDAPLPKSQTKLRGAMPEEVLLKLITEGEQKDEDVSTTNPASGCERDKNEISKIKAVIKILQANCFMPYPYN